MGDSIQWIDEFRTTDGEHTKKQQRVVQDDAAIGGLRSPHKAIEKILGASEFGEKLRDMLKHEVDRAVRGNLPETP